LRKAATNFRKDRLLKSNAGSLPVKSAELREQHEAQLLLPAAISAYQQGRYEDSRLLCRRIVEKLPSHFDALHLLGVSEIDCNLFEAAEATLRRALNVNPRSEEVQSNRGLALFKLKRYEEARQCQEQAIALKPNFPTALSNLGNVLLRLRRYEEAVESYDRALALRPDYADAHSNRGMALLELGRHDEAMRSFDYALALAAGHLPSLVGKGMVAMKLQRFEAALEIFNTVFAAHPDPGTILPYRARAYYELGQAVGANADFEAALAIDPACLDAIAGRIFVLDFLPDADFAMHQAARKAWWDGIGARQPRQQLRPGIADPDRRLVVGYVSGDFQQHSAAFAFLPVLRHHDHAQFEVIGYSCARRQDGVTATCRAQMDRWVDAAAMSDDELTERIQSDGVDILVDLSGHSEGNRLCVFARKPAPVQVTAWGHGTGTGLPTMDYFFADPVTVPEAVRPLFAETVCDLPSVITMDPITDAQPLTLPMSRTGHATFGVFNRINKISDEALALWGRLMHELPASRIVIKHGALDDPFVREALIRRFGERGVAEDRLTCLGATPRRLHLQAFADVDMSLDPFPQNGGISTWESLYMGVPVVAKLGNAACARAAGGILASIGLGDWVADDDDGYIAIAKKFAGLPEHLGRLRAELRAMIAGSPSGNGEVYTRHVEAHYRQFWRDYCASAARTPAG
jgi:predicted O-linked N-acetylglucosamine transferase (SPINDLY family)